MNILRARRRLGATDPSQRASLSRALMWLSHSLAVVCLLSTFLYARDVQLNDTTRPFHRDYAALKAWIVRSHEVTDTRTTHSMPVHVAGPFSPRLEAWWTPSSPLTDAIGVTSASTSRHSRYARWGFDVKDVQCPWQVSAEPHGASHTTAPASPSSEPQASTLVAVFIHGNAGDARQSDYWSCAVSLRHELMRNTASRTERVRLYAVSLAEQANIHRGALVRRQADFVADAVARVVANLTNTGGEGQEAEAAADTAQQTKQPTSVRVWLVGHSMGGVVARLSAALLLQQRSPLLHASAWSSQDPTTHSPQGSPVEGVLTFNTPHQHPPIFMDTSMSDIYKALRTADQSSDRLSQANSTSPTARSTATNRTLTSDEWIETVLSTSQSWPSPLMRMVSVTSGDHDLQIASRSTALDGVSRTLTPASASAASPHRVWLDSSEWCRGSRSHDGILLNPCVHALAATILLEPSSSRWEGLAGKGLVPERWRTRSAWGRMSCAHQLWAVSACVFSLYVVGAALSPIRPPSRSVNGTGAADFARVAPQTVLLFLGGRVAGFVVRRVRLGLASPWPWDAQTQSSALWRSVVWLPLAAGGQVAVGLLLGTWCVRAVEGLVRLLALSRPRFWRWWCPHARVSLRTRRGNAVFFFACVCIPGVFVVADAGGVTGRAVGFLVLCLAYSACAAHAAVRPDATEPPSAQADEEAEMLTTSVGVCVTPAFVSLSESARGPPPSLTSSCADSARDGLTLTLLTTLLVIHLQPFFVFRNILLSDTRDSRDLVDPLFTATQSCLYVCLVASVWVAGRRALHETHTDRQRQAKRVSAHLNRIGQSRALAVAALWLARVGMVMCAACVLDSWRAAVAVLLATPAIFLSILGGARSSSDAFASTSTSLV